MSANGRTLAGLRATGASLMRSRRSLGAGLVAAWMFLIWCLSSQEPSGEPTPQFMNWLGNCFHAPLFGLLAMWVSLTLPREGNWPKLDAPRIAFVLSFVLAYAIIDELHQSRVPGRDATGFDILTDFVGAACTLWIMAYLPRQDASEAGLWRRLGLGMLMCGIAGALAAWM